MLPFEILVVFLLASPPPFCIEGCGVWFALKLRSLDEAEWRRLAGDLDPFRAFMQPNLTIPLALLFSGIGGAQLRRARRVRWLVLGASLLYWAAFAMAVPRLLAWLSVAHAHP